MGAEPLNGEDGTMEMRSELWQRIVNSENSLEYSLDTSPRSLEGISLDSDSLYVCSCENPQEFLRISRALSRWPVVTIADATALIDYLAADRKLSVADPRQGILGEVVSKFKTCIGLHRSFGITFNSGTNALHAAYLAMGVQKGTTVAAPAYTFHATVTPALELGANLVLMDVNADDGNVTAEIVRKTVESAPATKVVVVNHNWGFPIVEMARIRDYLANRGIWLLEDGSHAPGATVDGQPIGSFGDIAVFSLHAHKIVAAGEGGLCFTDNPELNQRMLLVGHPRASENSFGASIDASVRQTGLYGLKFRMHVLGAVLASAHIDRLPQVLSNRRRNFAQLQQLLGDTSCVEMPTAQSRSCPTYYSVRPRYLPHEDTRADARAFVAQLNQYGVDIRLDQFKPLSYLSIYQQHWREYGSRALEDRRLYKPGDFPAAEEFCRDRLVFPVFSRSPALVRGVLEVIARHIHAACKG